MKISVDFDWDKHTTEGIRTFLIRYGKLPRGFLEERWETLTEAQRRWALLYQNIPKRFVEENWENISTIGRSDVTGRFWSLNVRHYSIRYGKVSPTFVRKNWPSLAPSVKKECLNYMELPIPLVISMWETLSEPERKKCWKKQKLSSRLTREQLPEYLVHKDEFVRVAATRSFKRKSANGPS